MNDKMFNFLAFIGTLVIFILPTIILGRIGLAISIALAIIFAGLDFNGNKNKRYN